MMDTLDPQMEWRRLSEHYGQMSDGELLALARQSSELTDVAQQSLAGEISRRGLKVEPEEPPASPSPATTDSSYADDRELVEICTVWSMADAFQLQTLLDRAGIPFFMGPEKATGVDAVTSRFGDGVIIVVQVMRIGLPWIRDAMLNYMPEDERGQERKEENSEFSVPTIQCPKCRSTEVILGHLIPEPIATDENSTPKYEWTCSSCGNEWEDDGIVKEG
jgi:hypothetical protein